MLEPGEELLSVGRRFNFGRKVEPLLDATSHGRSNSLEISERKPRLPQFRSLHRRHEGAVGRTSKGQFSMPFRLLNLADEKFDDGGVVEGGHAW